MDIALASTAPKSPEAEPEPEPVSETPTRTKPVSFTNGGLTNSHLPAGGLTPNTANLGSNSKKRFRTKFTQYQKDKMLEFAEKIGWKIQKRDEEDIQEFCREVGVDRGVLKVWMHNNKNTFGKKDQANGGIISTLLIKDHHVAANI
ncbi:hypothetical protein GOBAR_AA27105 [Gossypium barbadense]|uniref:ZF-HD dimerization-type domain-containing protein n=1 Tax=Gossypium barbadense TaxID=3634 RepID=A0A2P5WR99_GOSBA|nr:hypothetical protein GOBAR_AA27105 [Gossypium barbadense]